MRSRFVILFFVLFWISSVYADVLPDILFEDLKHEILEADFISLNIDKRNELIEKLRPLFQTNIYQAYDLIRKELSQELPHLKNNYTIKKIVGINKNSYTQVKPLEKIKINGAHAIHDLNLYSQNRIGHGTARYLRESRGEVLILATNANSPFEIMEKTLDPIEWTILPIPNLYEHWGIKKYFVQSDSNLKSSKIVWIIPPSIQYLQHYVNTFGLYSKTKVKGYFDHQSAESFKVKISNDVMQVSPADLKIDYLIFGYQKVWEQYLSTELKDEVIERTKIDVPAAHSNIVIYKIKSNKSPSGSINIGLFSTNSTLWGELINTYVPSYFHKDLKGVVFMGSAGSLDPDIKIYDLSVPASFVRAGRKIKISNMLTVESSSEAKVSRRHGHTFSPVQQNRSYLNRLISKNIETIDVEQSLLAEKVADYNRLQNADIRFGAVNLITDKPFYALNGESETMGLDQYDPAKKQNSRVQAVQFVMKNLREGSVSPRLCQNVISNP